MKSSKPWDLCDSILSFLTESESFAFEDDSDAFLTINDLFSYSNNNNNYTHLLFNPLQENLIPLAAPKKDLSKLFDQLVSELDSRSLKLVQQVDQGEKHFVDSFNSLKIDSTHVDSVHSPTTTVESAHNGSTSASTDSSQKKGYNLRSKNNTKDNTQDNTAVTTRVNAKKRKVVKEESDESSSSDEDDESFDPSEDSDVDESAPTTRSKTSLQAKGKSSSKEENDSSNQKKKKRKRTTYNKQHTDILKNFLFEHQDYPYPSEEKKYELLQEIEHSMTKEQLETWFVNHRRRYVVDVSKCKPQYSGPNAKSGFNKELEKKLKQEKK